MTQVKDDFKPKWNVACSDVKGLFEDPDGCNKRVLRNPGVDTEEIQRQVLGWKMSAFPFLSRGLVTSLQYSDIATVLKTSRSSPRLVISRSVTILSICTRVNKSSC
jgi:hypothetical protein